MINNILAVDIETDSLDFTKGNIKLISLYNEKTKVVYENVDDIRNILEDKSVMKVFHNAKFDVSWLKYNGIEVNNYTDTMIMAKLLGYENVKLDYLVKTYFNKSLSKELQHSDNWKGEKITDDHKKYCLDDAKYTFKLYNELIKGIDKNNLKEILEIEINALPAIVELTLNGIYLDMDEWKIEVKKLEEKAKDIELEFKSRLSKNTLNINSPKQIIEAFRENGIPIKSTADEVLAQFEYLYDEVRLLRKYRKISKNINTYGYKIQEYLDCNGVIRPSWNQIGAKTGRMSCSKPALQGVPSIMRKYFKARDGYTFVIADYSQVELRILAEVSKDRTLINAYKNDLDLHSITASKVINKPIEMITESERKIGKTLNFGIAYGITENGLRNQMYKSLGTDLTEEEAKKYRINFFESYKGVYIIQDILLRAKNIRSLGGRQWSSDLKSNQKLNYSIQGTGADILKTALSYLMESKDDDWKLCAVVHDEILLEVPEKVSNKAKVVLKDSMEKAMNKFIKEVPCKIDIKISNTWCK
ncbi:TPA: hypothetical protein KQW76_002748 [Clostridioides difficile]|nr:DNA polymerase [Clostridioides difficile]EJA6689689.1 hypothetical protein [Clostridioides difficile]EQH51471.1 3'-5' exonuclease family protein [Clostridioides difficile DA00256]MBJ9760739.1 hypothetical protein [Clostridioides difficile]MCA0587056.1 hypothetical protein [Clostridioides difficile]MDO0484834.1 hypothetical protein [Clostridioides difficile]